MRTTLESEPATMTATPSTTSTGQQNLEAAVTHFVAKAKDWRQRRMHGEVCVKLRFVNGVAVQWEAIQAEVHKSGQDASIAG